MTTWALNNTKPPTFRQVQHEGAWVVADAATGAVVDATPREGWDALARARYLDHVVAGKADADEQAQLVLEQYR